MKKICLLLLLASFFSTGRANNIALANVALNGQNTVSQYSLINFDVSWENSWRTITNETNYDGAWIFAKFRKKSSSLWQHATISSLNSTTPSTSVLQVSLDGKGAWIYQALPASDFTGNVNYTGAKLRWNYGADGVLNTDSVEIRVFALEMVYVPQGAFKLGSGGTETNHFIDGGSNNPFNVIAENTAITVANTTGNLYYSNNGNGGDQGGPIPAVFPKGFNAFWLMKYEASQQQYGDFLNNLDFARAANRNGGTYTGAHPNFIAPFPERAINSLSINDQLAFADWAGMRPFTELEYEKACRGFNQTPIPNEFPWGNTTITPTTGVTNQGLANETANNGNANYSNAYPLPTRTGIYATATSTRQSSGGTYYGIMDMGGNIWETCISIGSGGTTGGRAFTNVNGDGTLDLNGDANVSTWPTAVGGYARRGGNWIEAAQQLNISDRNYGINPNLLATRIAFVGIRLARTAE